jgi:hypothetical protein
MATEAMRRGARAVRTGAKKLVWMGWLIPFAMLSPVVPVGPYAIGIIELLVWAWGALAVLGRVRLPVRGSPMVPYLWLFNLGFWLASLNGMRFGINPQVADFTIFYRLGFYLVAWWLGSRTVGSMDRVAASWVTLILTVAIVAIVVLYGLLSYENRMTLLSPFWPDRSDLPTRALMDRFPGMGQNANIFAFFPLCLFLFSFSSFLRRRSGVLVPLLCTVPILATGSRRGLLQLGAIAAALYLFPGMRPVEAEGDMGGRRRRFRNRILVALVIAAAVFVLVTLVSRGIVSSRAIDTLWGSPDFEEDTQRRFRKMAFGMRRVSMAPLLGIPKPRSEDWSTLGYYLTMTRPHNEFIQIWMWHGLLGLLAHVYLLLSMVWRNIRHRMGMAWYLFYLVVIGQMFVDTAFKSYQFATLFFVIAGHNWRLLEERARLEEEGERRRASPPLSDRGGPGT